MNATHPALSPAANPPEPDRPLQILHLEDNARDRELVRATLDAQGFQFAVIYAKSKAEFQEALENLRFDVILSDYTLPSYGGMQALAHARELQPDTPYIFVSGTIGEERAVDSMRSGATDYVLKDNLHRLGSIMRRALREAAERAERQRAEAALKESQLLVKLAMQASNIGPWDWNLETNQVYFSPEWKRQLGYEDHELPNRLSEWKSRLHPEDRDRILAAIEGYRNNPKARYEVEFRLRHKDGSYRWIHTGAVLMRNEAGRATRMIGCHVDITQRKQAERQLLRAQRLESIGTLAAGVAHDLNNALAPIMMGVAMLKLQYPEESEILEMFEASARRGADMARQLVTFAKGAEGERIALQPANLVRELEKLMKGSFPKNIHFEVRCAQKLPHVLGDATQLHQVLLNLCVNARDAMPEGGRLTLDAGTRRLDAAAAVSVPDARPGNYVVIQVDDTGTGIPPNILDRIFDPFFTTKGVDKGTGLGLSTVMGIVKGHGGFVQVASQPGQGSTFTVYLPADNGESDTELISKVATEFRGTGETILFVDDEPLVRDMARAVLRRLNFTPLTATDGTDGLVQAARHRTKLRAVITDLHMPHMDGIAFARAIRSILPDIPIVVASGRIDEARGEEFKSVGVTRRLDKPFTEAQLAEMLKELLTPE